MIRIKTDLGLAGLYIVFDGSSFSETKKGTSHLIEHILCKNYDSLLSELSQHDITSNAYTANNEVVFWFQGLEESLSKFAQELTDRILSGLTCTEEQFLSEKKTVIEEYLDCFNSQSKGHFYNLMRQKLNYYGPIGEIKDLEEFTFQNCKDEIQLRFRKPSRIVLASNNINLSYNGKYQTSIDFNRPFEIAEYAVPVQKVTKDSKTSVLGIFPNAVNYEQRFVLEILLASLNEGLEAPLFQEIREKRGLSYFSWAFPLDLGNFSTTLVGACTANERADELIDVYQKFFSNVCNHFSKERFNVIKEKFLLQTKKQAILRYENCRKEITAGREGMDVDDILKLNYEDSVSLAEQHLNSIMISAY